MPTSVLLASRKMAAKGGRPRGRALSELELEHLRVLVSVREAARDQAREYEERIEEFVLQLQEESGCSTRVIAAALGDGFRYSTIQRWITNAKQRRGLG
jgi:hypothetical protein